ncbi:unnamed protein product [Polarella glacialis]|uniref:Reverse transcriptase domain-containing protein n=1 Tax=Polarella glacialis TaxID=89957 RepID=A0A813DHV2_POLGL|nr:unnamed protein product [Polarella glacialis]
MVLYLAPGNAAAYNERLLAWANQIISRAPGRSLPLIMLDGNAHVGLERTGGQINHHSEDDAAGSQKPTWHDFQEKDRHRYDTGQMLHDLNAAPCNELQISLDHWARQPETRQALQESSQAGRLDTYWQIINDEVCSQAFRLYPRKDYRDYIEQLAQELQTAFDNRDMKRVWRIARTIAGKHLGPKKRQYGIATGFIPPVADWTERLAQTGPQGGCLLEATDEMEIDVPEFCLSHEDVQQQFNSFSQPSDVEEQETQRVVEAMRGTKSHREVPRWSAPREAWLSALSCECDNNNNEGNGEDHPFRNVFSKCLSLIRTTSKQPSIWNISQTARIPKANNKSNCSGFRLIHLLDPVGKSWNKQLWQQSNSQHPHRSTGFIRHRTREQAIVQARCLQWKLHRARIPWVAVLFDVANAFPSPDHKYLDRVVQQRSDAANATVFSAKTPQRQDDC